MSFTTVSKNTQKLKFLIISDTQATSQDVNMRKKLINFIQKEYFDFFIHCGDVVQNGKQQTNWNNYFENFEKLTSKKIGLYTQGNHDFKNKGELFYINIPLDLHESDLSRVGFGDFCCFLGLNIEIPVNYDLLRNQLELTTEYHWKFCFFHRPIFNSMEGREDMNIEWDSLFNKYNISLVFNGHNHIYERLLINKLNYIVCPAISGSIKDPDRFHFSNNTLHNDFFRGYIIAEVNYNSLSVKVLGYNEKSNEIFQTDDFTIYS